MIDKLPAYVDVGRHPLDEGPGVGAGVGAGVPTTMVVSSSFLGASVALSSSFWMAAVVVAVSTTSEPVLWLSPPLLLSLIAMSAQP